MACPRPVDSRLRGDDGPVTMTGGQGGLVVYVVYGQVMVFSSFQIVCNR